MTKMVWTVSLASRYLPRSSILLRMQLHPSVILSLVLCTALGGNSEARAHTSAPYRGVVIADAQAETSQQPAVTESENTKKLSNVATSSVGTLHVGEHVVPLEIGDALPPHERGVKLRVGVCDLPPWTIAPTESTPYWSGLGALVWKNTAKNLDIDYTLSVHTFPGLLEAVAKGDIDIAMTGIPIIPENLARFGMAPPFDQSGISIATRVRSALSFASVTERVIAAEITIWLFALLMFAGLFGLLFWIVERKKNPTITGSGFRGFGESMWWSLTTLATVGYGDRVPTTGRGKIIGALWMASGFLLMTIAAAVFTSALTAAQLQPLVKSPTELITARVGVAIGTTGDTYATRINIPAVRFATFEQAVTALREEKIDAIVGSSTTLAYLVEQYPGDHITVLPRPLLRTFVSFGTRFGMDPALEKRIELEVLKTAVSAEYSAMRAAMLGRDTTAAEQDEKMQTR